MVGNERKHRSGGRCLVLEARNEALRLVDDQSMAVAGAAEARLFGPHRHGARARVLWTLHNHVQATAGRFGPAGLVANAPTPHKPHPAFSCRLSCLRGQRPPTQPRLDEAATQDLGPATARQSLKINELDNAASSMCSSISRVALHYVNMLVLTLLSMTVSSPSARFRSPSTATST